MVPKTQCQESLRQTSLKQNFTLRESFVCAEQMHGKLCQNISKSMPILAKSHFGLTFSVHFSKSGSYIQPQNVGSMCKTISPCTFDIREVEIGSWVDVGQHLKRRGCFEHVLVRTLVSLKRWTGLNKLNQKSQILPACFSVTMMSRRYPVPK